MLVFSARDQEIWLKYHYTVMLEKAYIDTVDKYKNIHLD